MLPGLPAAALATVRGVPFLTDPHGYGMFGGSNSRLVAVGDGERWLVRGEIGGRMFMTKSVAFLLLFFGLCVANVSSQSQNVSPRDAKALCNRLAEIKEFPRGERGVDAAWDALFEAGEAVVPCLIDKITDTTVMPDPRCPRFTDELKVGDTAYFVLVEILKIDFLEMLPADVQQKYKTEGTYAYHDYIERKGSRKQLQSKLREWYQQKQSAKR